MGRIDLVQFQIVLENDGTPVTIKTHPGTDFDEVAAIWLIQRFATRGWVMNNSQNGVIYLGVGESAQRGVFNEHYARDTEHDNSHCCATLVASALGLMGNAGLKPLLDYALGQDNAGIGTKADIAFTLKQWRLVRTDNDVAIRWAIDGLEMWSENVAHDALSMTSSSSALLDIETLYWKWKSHNPTDNRYDTWLATGVHAHDAVDAELPKAIQLVKNHLISYRIQTPAGPATICVLPDIDHKLATIAFWKLGIPHRVFIRTESSGHFQIYTPKYLPLHTEVFRRLIHRWLTNRDLLSEDIRRKQISEQIELIFGCVSSGVTPPWKDQIHAHPATCAIYHGSLTARPLPILYKNLTVRDLTNVVESALMSISEPKTSKVKGQQHRPAPHSTPTSAPTASTPPTN